MRRIFPFVPVFLLSLTPALHAVNFTLDGQSYNVEDITGTGANKALFEIDFGTNSVPDTHLFAYQWDAPLTPQTFGDMMAALQNDSTTGITYNAFPGFLDTLFYKTQQPPIVIPTPSGTGSAAYRLRPRMGLWRIRLRHPPHRQWRLLWLGPATR